MPVFVYKNGKWRTLAGKKIAKDGVWKQPGDNAKFYLGGVGHNLGYGAFTSANLPEMPEIPATPEMPGVPSITPLSFVSSSQPSTGTAWYVTPNGNGDKDGTSWANAADNTSIHAIMIIASSGDYVCFAEGDYSLEYPMTLPAGISLYGGFVQGSSYSWASRDGFSNPTKFTIPTGGAYSWITCPTSIAGQVIDGFCVDGHYGVVVGDGRVPCRNMYVIRGAGTFTGALTNAVLTGITSSSAISGNCEDVHCSACAAVTVSGTATDCHFRNMTGTVTVSGASTDCTVASSKAVSFNDTATGCIVHSNTGNVVFGNNDTITECQAINITGTVLFSNDAVDCIVHTISGRSAISGNATNLTVANGDVSIGGDVNSAIIAGSFLCHGDVYNSKITGLAQDDGCSVYGGVTNSVISNCWFNADSTTSCKVVNCELGVDGVGTSIGTLFYNCNGVSAFANNIGDSVGSSITNGMLVGTSDSSVYCNYRIVNEAMQYYNGTSWIEVDNGTTGWTAISGYSTGSTVYAYGIRDGGLYRLGGTTATRVGTDAGWTAISGYSTSGYYAYGIRDGGLYQLGSATATRVGTDAGWTAISGYSTGSGDYAYGIRVGGLYQISGTTATRVGPYAGWTAISGYSYGSTYHAYGILGGELYQIRGTMATRVGTDAGWTAISGYSSGSAYNAYGIRVGGLYMLRGTTATRVGTDAGWTAISGYSYSSTYSAYGIRVGGLYQIRGTTATLINIGPNCLAKSVYGVGYDSYPSVYQYNNLDDSTANKNIYLNCTAGGGLPFSTIALVGKAENCLFANCEVTASGNARLVCDSAKFVTAVNSIGSIPDGVNNVFWNNTGTITPTGNAQSVYNENNGLTLGNNNLISKFTQTGYYPARGKQDIGSCPDPDTQAEAFALWVQGFGNWVPILTSLMYGAGTYDGDVSDDLNNVLRPNPPTYGAYEPIS